MKKVKKAKKTKGTVVVVGLGYVGLPLACLCAEKGYRVIGVDISVRKNRLINNGKNPLTDNLSLDETLAKKLIKSSADYKQILKSEIIVICVPTPVDKLYQPDLTIMKAVAKNIGKLLKKGQLVIVESTINPGVSEEVIIPILESNSGLKVGKDYYFAHCPERISPGNPAWNITNIPRVVGAYSKTGLSKAIKFYKSIIVGNIRGMKSLKEAESSKIVENAFRDINIAFVNELAKSFEKLNIDIVDVIEGASTKPFAFLPHWPSIGVGGHCIPVDPYYLIERARQSGFDHKFLKLAREINNSMPKYTVDLLVSSLNRIGKAIKGTRIGLLGLSYKADVGDIRESPALKVKAILDELEADIEVYDPFFPDRSTVNSLDELLKKSQALIIATNHKEFVDLDLSKLKKYGIKVVVDGKNCLNKNKIRKLEIVYKGIGR